MHSHCRHWTLVPILLLLGACGQRGPLYLPDDTPEGRAQEVPAVAVEETVEALPGPSTEDPMDEAFFHDEEEDL